MKKILLLAYLFIAANSAFAQTDAAKYADVITTDGLKNRLTIIASDEMQGRETGTEGQRRAAAYIESQFKAMGLQQPKGLKGYQQLYPLYQDSLLSSELKVKDIVAEYGKDFISPLNANENGSFKGSNLVFVGYGIDDAAYSDYNKVNVKGKIVVFFYGEPKKEGKYFLNTTGNGRASEWTFPGTAKKLAAAAAKGAVGALVINQAAETFSPRMIDMAKKTSVYYPGEKKEKTINFALLSHAFAKNILPDFDTLLRQVKAGEAFAAVPQANKISVNYRIKKYRNVINASNVLGVIEGTDKKDEYVFLTGHYDHLGMRDGKIYYGADDDGSGTVAVMQMAAAFAKAKADGKGPRRTIVFMTVSGEEKGLWGSEYYSEHPVYPLSKTSVDLNTDMVGRIDTERKKDDTMNYVYVVGHDKLSSDLPIINEKVNSQYTHLVLDYKFDDPNDPHRIYFRSDHYNFARKGVPVLFFYDGMLKADYHKPTDTIDKIEWPLYEKRVKMIFHTAWDIANRDEMLKRDIPLPEGAR
ncbi:M28 family peptidase [Ferruginibacter sp. HRS2-29]|uniref:M28 family peptidase n=1 Tax=Ferruginibacter sp. HRS2-29 TaxID=2487334 RepID=UPI0020CF9255|nr:M28 family peptidase [Ferruginibacter sp. HRS2-29]MCP9752198.1 M28 family peptidase [Ferruginibacter sp. HRS2-29]